MSNPITASVLLAQVHPSRVLNYKNIRENLHMRGFDHYDEATVQTLMIEFAKLHVEAAIKTCIEEAPSGSSTDTVSYEDVVKALKDCYPLTNIK
jgi:hypothetical protein